MTRIDDIRTRLSKASPGPWVPFWGEEENEHFRPSPLWEDATGRQVVDQNYEDVELEHGDYVFVTHAPDDVAFLLKRLEEVQSVAEELVRHAQASGYTPLEQWKEKNTQLVRYLQWLTKEDNK